MKSNSLESDCVSRQAVINTIYAAYSGTKLDADFARVLLLWRAIKALPPAIPQDLKEIEEVINCDADAETKCKMISNILAAKPHYFEEPHESEVSK